MKNLNSTKKINCKEINKCLDEIDEIEDKERTCIAISVCVQHL